MKKTACLFAFTIMVLWHVAVFADTSVWVVTSGGQTVYLGGTIHMLRAWDFPLPAEFEQAYQKSDTIVFETDIGRLNDPGNQQILLSEMMYTDGRTLDKVLSHKAYMTLMGYAEKIGVPISSLLPFKPPMAVMTLFSVELQRNGITEDGVDQHFYDKAVADGKSTIGLESLEDHIGFLADMSTGDEDDFVIHSIKDFKRMSQVMSQMVAMWRDGDEKGLDQIFIAEMKTKYPRLYEQLLIERNKNWMPIIESYFKTPATEFVLVGAAHLVGEQGILKLLAERGYTISRLP